MSVELDVERWKREWLIPGLQAGLNGASIVLSTRMIDNMGSEGGGVLRKAGKKLVKRADGTRAYKRTASVVAGPSLPGRQALKGRGRNVYYPSPPGRFPGIREGGRGGLISGIGVLRVEGLTAAVGSAERVGYGKVLELSDNPRMRRPWAMRSLTMAKAQMMDRFVRDCTAALSRGVSR